jgi:ATP adenylyltransferase
MACIDSSDGPATESCFLCRYRDQNAESDPDNFVVTRTEHSIVVLNRFPYNNGHLLVAPLSHIGSLTELSDDALTDSIRRVRWITALLGRLLTPDGFNVGLNLGRAAGAGLPGHLHWHVVPRWNGDTNFMPVLGEAKVISQSLEALYDMLVEEIAAEAK